jgi:uncharacterized protein (DUF2252 family)
VTIARTTLLPNIACALGVALAAACGPAPRAPQPTPSAATASSRDVPLAVPLRASDLADNPPLLAKLLKSPFAFYRFIDGPFTERVCQKYVPKDAPPPSVNLHGDAHLEQYAVADDGRGLADFDAASVGPAIVDLLRFSTSLHLVARGRMSEADADRAVERFLEGYRAALVDPNATAPEPRAAARIREGFDRGAGPWLDRVEKLMRPMTEAERAKLARSNETYVAAMLKQNPELDRAFFTLKRAGPLAMGIGSAHEMKFLARVEGPSPAPDDDVMLEVKQVIGHSLGSCVHGGEWGDAVRVILGQARLSTAPQKLLGYVELDGKSFYVHAWRVHYTELDADDVRTADELAELAYDVGVQLGHGHPKQIAEPGQPLCNGIADDVKRNDAALREAARALAAETIAAWEAFRRTAGATP